MAKIDQTGLLVDINGLFKGVIWRPSKSKKSWPGVVRERGEKQKQNFRKIKKNRKVRNIRNIRGLQTTNTTFGNFPRFW